MLQRLRENLTVMFKNKLITPRYRELFPETYLNGSNVVTMANTYLRNSDVIEMVGRKVHCVLSAVAVR